MMAEHAGDEKTNLEDGRMMICENCGATADDAMQFCRSCGMYLRRRRQRLAPPDTSGEDRPGPVPEAVAEAHGLSGVEPVPEPGPDPWTTSPRRSPAGPRRPHKVVGAPAVLGMAATRVAEGERLAKQANRPDLARHLESTRTALERPSCQVAVIGEFKQGKSTLVNALLWRAVCPVDADIVTAVPTLVTYSDRPTVVAHFQPGSHGGELTSEKMPLSRSADLISAVGSLPDGRKLRGVELGLPHRILRSGLSFVDTPGVGGIESAQGAISLGALATAQGALFVTDAGQELTEPEMRYLREASRRCPVAVVVTKIDLYAEWRRIVDINTSHLARAGLSLEVFPVSSFLRLRAMREPDLNEESGFRQLMSHLASTVVKPVSASISTAASSEIRFVTQELTRQVEAERVVIADPGKAGLVVAELTEQRARTERLVSPNSGWQQVLNDGIQDLLADIPHDLHARLRSVSQDAESVIDQGDPNADWPDLETWLRWKLAQAALANHDLLWQRTNDLVHRVASQFDVEAVEVSIPTSINLDAPEQVALPDVETLSSPTGPLAPLMMALRSGAYVPSTVVGLAAQASGSVWLVLVTGPMSVAVGAALVYKLVRDERRRQVSFRRQQGKIAVRRCVEEVTFVLTKDCRDTLRSTQRILRDEFSARAASQHRSSTAALTSARAAAAMTEGERVARSSELERQSDRVRQLEERLTNREPMAGASKVGNHA